MSLAACTNPSAALLPAILVAALAMPCSLSSQSLDLPSSSWGISLGNSTAFTGLRLNYRDSHVQYVRGVNVTLWAPGSGDEAAQITGISLGTLPGGGNLTGVQLGLLGIGAETNLNGITVGGLGVGAGSDLAGLSLGGFGIGAGRDLTGVSLALFGIGAGGDLAGLTLGGLGVGAARDLTGVTLAGLGIGAGGSMAGIAIAGFGVGAGAELRGLTVAGLGIGSPRISGVTLAGLGIGAADRLAGVSIAGLGVGADTLRGLTIAGLSMGGRDLWGAQLALGTVRVSEGGRAGFLCASGFNHNRGTQVGLAVGLVNYAERLRGLQLGVVNIVQENPRYLRVLPLLNARF